MRTTRELLESTKTPTYLGFTLDTEINCSKHINRFCEKGRKRLQLLKYISGRDWGANAGTLNTNYTALIRPILEYGYQIYQVAANTNLKKIERIQFSAARIITGLRNSCPNDIACYEADLQPLSLRREINMAKYVAKLKSFKPCNRSSNLLSNWTNNQRLKKDSPLGLIWKQGLADIEVEPSVPFNLLTPTTVLSNVTFNEDLNRKFIKHEEHPELLRQLALEIINNISSRALVIYTERSKSDSGRTGSGIFMKTSTGEFRYRFRNPDHSSVFRSELTAISEALSLALDFRVPDVWILTDNCLSLMVVNLEFHGDTTNKDFMTISKTYGQLKEFVHSRVACTNSANRTDIVYGCMYKRKDQIMG
ncbi:putative RNA-directed DNA polymerase from transposon BS [Caerostris extrusa]|uniref:RNA-directed DNA polymerase from transposon BS n=1 Tax=Caerostris extrusa TaxID=172846 RepID=A0AAV4XQ10_CAEEX|nr:putative RNA-directed DNA polymerase from transposon BS [Caerostris extrusa]